jgi:hypothetical protein
MSGKAPPRGPRALVGTLPSVVTQPPAGVQHISGPSSPVKRFGVAPPTGPRSLTSGVPKSSNAAPALGTFKGIRLKSAVNGHISQTTNSSGLGSDILNKAGASVKKVEEGLSDDSAVSVCLLLFVQCTSLHTLIFWLLKKLQSRNNGWQDANTSSRSGEIGPVSMGTQVTNEEPVRISWSSRSSSTLHPIISQTSPLLNQPERQADMSARSNAVRP